MTDAEENSSGEGGNVEYQDGDGDALTVADRHGGEKWRKLLDHKSTGLFMYQGRVIADSAEEDATIDHMDVGGGNFGMPHGRRNKRARRLDIQTHLALF